ncbi:SGNH/GDSL hydrolase family protein [Dyadobacter psychrotolerans]|uniref:SGNH/GDSL hydrolase family protein n=1 Tax=Dyadobacter psychrotolerans TaxID=2541721 RepID=A0A4R5DZ31_9BACT|nr:SGNH/GDSL hydrolase family protein [Dyadobacter psychrotolerans]TDE17421.1 SGNH/GDSL hydrolase family protein [Dyadobacter psychrotolerans]
MKCLSIISSLLFILILSNYSAAQIAKTDVYLENIKNELNAVWPKSRTINLVFHGHSVPAGFWENHEVHTLESYPNLVLKTLKEKYPYAVINVIVTAIGGEGSVSGEKRFERDVLVHKPDVLFIDYALNDRFAPLEKTGEALEKMIKSAQAQNIKVIMLTPSPDQRIDISDPANPLDPYVVQIRSLADKYKTGLADPYIIFQKIIKQGRLKENMASVNHPNKTGHTVIVDAIKPYF